MRRALLLTAVGLVLLSGCRKHEEEEVETTGVVPVAVATARRGTIRALITATAVVTPASGAELDVVPPAAGRIAELPVAAGDRVKKNGLLIRFDVPVLAADLGARQAELKSADAAAAIARQSLDRQRRLVDRGIAAAKDVEAAQRDQTSAEAAVASAAAALAAAKELVSRSIVRAPFDGVVASRTHNPGDLVEPGGEPILRFIDPARLQVEASVPVADLPRVRAGAEARITGPEPLAEEHGSVISVPGAVDPVSGTAIVRVALDAGVALPAGTPVRADIVTDERADALVVPATAIVREGSETFVYVVDDEQTAHRRRVTVGLVADPDAEIISGVEPGERVVSQGAAGLPEGAKVAIRE